MTQVGETKLHHNTTLQKHFTYITITAQPVSKAAKGNNCITKNYFNGITEWSYAFRTTPQHVTDAGSNHRHQTFRAGTQRYNPVSRGGLKGPFRTSYLKYLAYM